MTTLLISRSKTAPTWVKGKAKSLWRSCQDVITFRSGLSLDEIQAKASVVGTVFIEDMAILAELAPKLVDWDRVWKIIEALVGQEVIVYFVKEDIQLSGTNDDAFVILRAAANAITEIRSLKKNKIHRSQIERAKSAGNNMNWVMPDKEMVNALVKNIERLGIQAGCKESNISRQTYYNWRKKGIIPL